jgi:hypothetical protein
VNLAFLGDALDHWKGSLFESLQQGQVIRDFAVDPMASDLAEWQPDDFALFSKLLRIDRSQVISHRRPLSDRNGYFGEIEHPGDLFLDPDTGIATGKVSAQHVAPAEIAALLKSTDRLLAIYQHVRAQRVCDRVDAVCAAIRTKLPDAPWCSYESGTVAMIFVASNSQRVASVSSHFRGLLDAMHRAESGRPGNRKRFQEPLIATIGAYLSAFLDLRFTIYSRS